MSGLKQRYFVDVVGLFLLAFVAAVGSAQADDLYGWRLAAGAARAADAEIFSTNALTTGARAIDYHPVLTISCDRARPEVWSQSIRLRVPIAGRAGVDVSVRIDGRGKTRENWRLGDKNRSIVLDGEAGISRIAGAGRMRVGWRIGFFAGDGEAVFLLNGIGDTLTTLAATCGVPVPGG